MFTLLKALFHISFCVVGTQAVISAGAVSWAGPFWDVWNPQEAAQCRWTTAAVYQPGIPKLPAHILKVPRCRGVAVRAFHRLSHISTSNPELSGSMGPAREWDLAQSWGHLPIITCRLPERSGHNPSFIQANWKFSPLFLGLREDILASFLILNMFCILRSFLNPKETESWAYSQRLPWIITSLGNSLWFFGRQEACRSLHPENNWDHISKRTVKGL